MSEIKFGPVSRTDRIHWEEANTEPLSKTIVDDPIVDDPIVEVPIWVLEEVQDTLRQTQNYRDEVRTNKETSLDRTIERTKNLVDNLLKISL